MALPLSDNERRSRRGIAETEPYVRSGLPFIRRIKKRHERTLKSVTKGRLKASLYDAF